jgi:hypothetical protein
MDGSRIAVTLEQGRIQIEFVYVRLNFSAKKGFFEHDMATNAYESI